MIKFIITAAVIVTSCLSWAGPGDDESSGTRGGGNIIASDFFDKGIELLKLLEPRSPTTANGQIADTQVLNKIFQKTVLSISEDNLYLNGSVVDAINYPKKNMVQINALTWRNLNKQNRYRLVIHEILGLAGIPDIQYKTSQELLNIAYIGINWDRGYRPACSGLRFVSNEKSLRILSAIRAFFDSKNGLSNFSLPSFTCNHGVNLQGFEYSNCNLAAGSYRADVLHENLISALSSAGVAKYTMGSNGQTEVYAINGISCSSGSNVTCGIDAYWNTGCPVRQK